MTGDVRELIEDLHDLAKTLDDNRSQTLIDAATEIERLDSEVESLTVSRQRNRS